MFVDTHCHLNMMAKSKNDTILSESEFLLINNILEQAKHSGVDKILTVGTSIAESINSVNIAKRFENVFAAVGIHPCDSNSSWLKDFKEVEKFLKNNKQNKIVAVGETGLDFYHKPFNKQRQIDVFKAHIELSLKFNLPLTIHVRESADEVLLVLEEYKKEVRGVIHCFFQDKFFADTVLDWGLYLGINGPITYPKNQAFRDLVATLPLDRILLETDAPFLPPQEFRGKQNSPAYIPIFAQTIAELKNIALSELEKITTENAELLFEI